jgi:hypothetical protein
VGTCVLTPATTGDLAGAALQDFIHFAGNAGMRTHIKIVAIVNILYSMLGLLATAGMLVGGLFSGIFSGGLFSFLAISVASVVGALILGAFSVFGLIAGFGLLNHQQWARWVIIAVSAFRLFRWPFGTLFGAYSLWVLMSDETQAEFAASL